MIDSYKFTQFLTNKELFDYLRIASDVGNPEFIMKYKQKLGELAGFVADQNLLRTKAMRKLPSFYKAGCFYTGRSLEQCTDEAVANYKASLLKGETILTLASGLGADDVAFSSAFRSVVSVDNDPTLNSIAHYNFGVLGIRNIERITSKAEDFLQQNHQRFDVIYTDPDRRDEKGRQILLSQHQPDVIGLLPELLKIAHQVWIKCSPVYDIAMAIREIPAVSEIHCIALKGEMKEMLLKVDQTAGAELKIVCTDIQSGGDIKSETFSTEDLLPDDAEDIAGYFFEAGAPLVKARKHHSSAARRGLRMIDRAAPFYTGPAPDPSFIGKCMRIADTLPYNVKGIKTYLRSKGIESINIKSRGTKTETTALFKQLGVKEGGDDFLFICPFKGKTVVVCCEVIVPGPSAPLRDPR